MVAVIRLKRRLDEDPTETLVLNYKKFKCEGSEPPECISTTFQLIGTINQAEENISHTTAPTQFQKRNRLDSRQRLEKRRQSHKYKVMFCDKSKGSGITLNVENETVDPISNEHCEYVFDVYTIKDVDTGSFIENLPCNEAKYCSVEVLDCQDIPEDCNLESKYIVEYPDESHCEGSESIRSISEYVDIVEYMEGMVISEQNELRSIESVDRMTED